MWTSCPDRKETMLRARTFTQWEVALPRGGMRHADKLIRARSARYKETWLRRLRAISRQNSVQYTGYRTRTHRDTSTSRGSRDCSGIRGPPTLPGILIAFVSHKQQLNGSCEAFRAACRWEPLTVIYISRIIATERMIVTSEMPG